LLLLLLLLGLRHSPLLLLLQVQLRCDIARQDRL
jgi:hypothetical protein